MDEASLILRYIALVGLFLLSGFFSGSEVALFSFDTLDKRKAKKRSDRASKILLGLLSRPRSLIITLLVGNEIVNITISTLAAALTDHYLAGASQVHRTLVSIAVVVPLLLVFGEITPKTIAYHAHRTWAYRVARPLHLFYLLVYPIQMIFRMVADTVVSALGGERTEKTMSEEEFLILVDRGSASGDIHAEEARLIHEVFKFGDRPVSQVMTPKERVFSIPSDTPLEEVGRLLSEGTYSRVPVIKPRTGEVIGLLHVKDFITRWRRVSSLDELVRPPFYVSQNTKCLRLMREFQKRRMHFAVVLDQHGRMAGIATLEDLLEELVGEIHDEKEDAA